MGADAALAAVGGGGEVITTALPTGADKSGVTSQAISVPQGSGKIDGMGESFSAQLSTGIATFSVPFALPDARGTVTPSLSLEYSSSAGSGVAGLGWDAGVPSITRQTDRGVPKYQDGPAFDPDQDRFVFNGGQELVPICVVGSARECAGALTGEVMPPWSAGSMYFRPRVEGSFFRFFWSPNRETWRVQDKSGVTMEFGVPLDGSGNKNGLDRNPDQLKEIYRWHMVRQYDTYGGANPSLADANPTPVNVIVYRYLQDGGMAYLSDIFDTTPAAQPTTLDTSRYAHHTHLVYELRTDPTFSYRSGWRIDQRLRLRRVDVTSKAFNDGENGPRRQLRRYHLSYEPGRHASLLSSLQLEGRCAGGTGTDPNAVVAETSTVTEDGNGELPETSCPRLPAMKFGYSDVAAFNADGTPSNSGLTGYEAFDARVRTFTSSPRHSVDEELTDLYDINSDALPDVLVTAPGTHGNAHAVFFNGSGGVVESFGPVQPMGLDGASPTTIKLSNLNVTPLDLDGDATINLLHMPMVKTYSVFTPTLLSSGWTWVGRAVTSATDQNPKIDFGRDTLDTKTVDVNFDGLVDLVVSTGLEFQTFFALGRYAGGDGQFGSARWTAPDRAAISTDPVRSCVPWAGTAVRFSDADTQLADMNGDGIQDIVRLRRGDIRYWPGRGNGVWGTGRRDDCPSHTFADGRHIQMDPSPQFSDIEGTSLRIDDVNGDGLDDLVQVRFDALDIWLNVDGQAWTERHIIRGTPPSPSYANRVRLVDVNGSGTRDILWGDGGDYSYIDLQGGTRPGLLTRVENGLGKSTDVEYTTSTAEMLAADQRGGTCDADGKPWASPWCTKMPIVVHVVKRVTESDNLVVAGKPPCKYVTEYDYRDPAYDGGQREFRGFRKARSKHVGDANSPSDFTESTFLVGECEDETDDGTTDCAPSEGWRDNPRDALKGLPVVTEQYDEHGVYLSTTSMTYRLRKLLVGLDGRQVRHAFENSRRAVTYDTSAGTPVASTSVLATAVELELASDPGWDPFAQPEAIAATVRADTKVSRPLRGANGYAIVESSSAVDFFGNPLVAVARGCTGGPACTSPDKKIYTFTKPFLPPGEETGWLWRTQRSYVSGSVHTALRKDVTTTFNEQGDALTTQAVLAGTLPLDRAEPASLPSPEASIDGTITLSTNHYSTFGALSREEGANQRCRDIGYDSAFGSLAIFETIYRNGCDNQGLTTSAGYDRGLGLASVIVDVQSQRTYLAYDGLGRASEVRDPDPLGSALEPPLLATTRFEYLLPGTSNPVAYSVVHTQTQDGPNPQSTEYLDSYEYVDGLGRTVVTLNEADPAAGDEGNFIATEFTDYDNKLAVRRKYLPFFTNAPPLGFPIGQAPTAPYGRQRYDAFGREFQTFDLDGTVILETRYHALSNDVFDAADLEPGPHQGTPASTTNDGHGRPVRTTERAHVGGAIEARHVETSYLPTGEPEVITRRRGSDEVVRWMRYDSLGRMVLNVEPNTTANYNPIPTTDPGTLRAWRYAYNDTGNLVGTSDARGCGVNLHYDRAGRLLAEDYARCESHHPLYTPPNLAARSGVEVLYLYDTLATGLPSGFSAPPGYDVSSPLLVGQLAGVLDRGSATFSTYDRRKRAVRIDRRVARPDADPEGALPTSFGDRYATRWYRRDFAFDAANREIAASTGSTLTNLGGTAVTSYGFPDANDNSVVTSTYSRRGTTSSVAGSYGTLVARATRAADDKLKEVEYGDAAATTKSVAYDDRRRPRSVQAFRAAPSIWTPPSYLPPPTPDAPVPTTLQLLLQDQDITYDAVGNPVEIHDWRNAAEWPDGAKPVTRKIQYDDLYRAMRVSYEYPSGTDSWVSPFAAENAGAASLQDPRRATPSPHTGFSNRSEWQSFTYDWLGNTSHTDDDAHGFYDRSLGSVTNDVAANKPYQLQSAAQSGASQPGELATLYDDSGNLRRLNLERQADCLPDGAECSQRFDYQWDELGRLVRARRWDVSAAAIGTPGDTLPASNLVDADLRYAYDASNERVLKVASDAGQLRNTLYVFHSLELRRASFAAGEYALTTETEVPYLASNEVGIGRVVFEEPSDGEPRLGASGLHVFLELGDDLGSTSAVIDKGTSELVEYATYQAYGGAESDYRPERWRAFREDYRFTGKEDDVEVNLQYFGKRFYSPFLNRWISADPLEVHTPGEADPNLYAYVSGQPLRATDPVGLDSDDDGSYSASGHESPAVPDHLDLGKFELKSPMEDIQNFMEARARIQEGLDRMTEWQKPIVESLNRSSARLAVYSEILSYAMPPSPAAAGTSVGVRAATTAARRSLLQVALTPLRRQLAIGRLYLSSLTLRLRPPPGVLIPTVARWTPAVGRTGAFGEQALSIMLGGATRSQARFNTSRGLRIVDELAGRAAHESKVGRMSLTPFIRREIAKDMELMGKGTLESSTWYFFKSPVTGQFGPTVPLRKALEKGGFKLVFIHWP